MKIRNDFVTNSSSSSFVTIHISGGKLLEILNQYSELFEDLELTDDSFVVTAEDWYTDVPRSKSDIVNSVVDFIERLVVGGEPEEEERAEELCDELNKHEREILATIQRVDWEQTDYIGSSESESGRDTTKTSHYVLDGDQDNYEYNVEEE